MLYICYWCLEILVNSHYLYKKYLFIKVINKICNRKRMLNDKLILQQLLVIFQKNSCRVSGDPVNSTNQCKSHFHTTTKSIHFFFFITIRFFFFFFIHDNCSKMSKCLKFHLWSAGVMIYTRGVQLFLSVGHVTNFRHQAEPHKKYSFSCTQ